MKNKNSFKKYMGRVWYDKSSISFRENVSIMLAENCHAIDLSAIHNVLVGAQSRAKMYENTKRGKNAMEMTAYGWNGQQMSRNSHKNNNNFNELNFTADSINGFNNLALYWSHLKSTFRL